jgi:hypothetical protein
MFGIKSLLNLIKGNKEKYFGLCHACFKSNVELSESHEIICVDCFPRTG